MYGYTKTVYPYCKELFCDFASILTYMLSLHFHPLCVRSVGMFWNYKMKFSLISLSSMEASLAIQRLGVRRNKSSEAPSCPLLLESFSCYAVSH